MKKRSYTKKKNSKYNFRLKNIDLIKINARYGLSVSNNIPNDSHIHPSNTTDLNQLEGVGSKNSPPTIKFMDETKRVLTCTLSSIDFDKGDRFCGWCKHCFDSTPLGCPIEILPDIEETTYLSTISKNTYTIRAKEIKSDIVYLTDGMFCSINCVHAWIDNNSMNEMYSDSMDLLVKMWNNLKPFSGKGHVIPCAAPDWRILTRFGGYISIRSFREDFEKIAYEHRGTNRQNVLFCPISRCFEEKLKF